MKEELSKKIIVIFTALFILGATVLLVCLPKKTVSENENRYLADFPELHADVFFNGDYMRDIEIYINDHFPFRDIFVGLKSQIDRAIGKKDLNGIYLAKDNFLIQSFDGYDAELMQHHAEIIENFATSTNVTTYMLLAPTSNAIYQDKRPRYSDDPNQVIEIERFYDLLSVATPVRVYPDLLAHAEDAHLYFRQDHHWTMHGAYLAYLAYCKTAQISPIPASQFDIEQISCDFCGTYYSFSKIYSLPPDTIDVYIPKFDTELSVFYVNEDHTTNSLYNPDHLKTKDQYAYFLDGNHPQIIITNDSVKNDESLLVIKDSYANDFIPFLVHHYHKIYVLDMRFFSQNLSEYVVENAINQVLFLYNIHTIRTDMGILKVR